MPWAGDHSPVQPCTFSEDDTICCAGAVMMFNAVRRALNAIPAIAN